MGKREPASPADMPRPRRPRNAARPAKPTKPPAAPEPVRHFAPRGIAALLAPVLRPAFRRRAPAGAQLLADWPALAGPALAARATPVKFAAGTLTLACSGTAAMELQLLAPTLIARLNLGLGSAAIERLRFVQRPAITAAAPPRIRAAWRPPPQPLPDGALGDALARLYQGINDPD